MTIFRHKLPDGSELMVLEEVEEEWPKIGDVTSALVFPNGYILIQQLAKLLFLTDEKIVKDIQELSVEELDEKYGLPVGEEFWEMLKEGVQRGRYPLGEGDPEERLEDYSDTVLKYIEEISKQAGPENKRRYLETVIEKCREEIRKTKTDKE